ncbi:hypothetical protein MycrhDRAFT_3086 [Mycolicibacterium rhodesiae JS60]|nr:hypothetical protein MycrhDRAFT_3086 [Mycolicibacterium rhodesiae JS60]
MPCGLAAINTTSNALTSQPLRRPPLTRESLDESQATRGNAVRYPSTTYWYSVPSGLTARMTVISIEDPSSAIRLFFAVR